MNRLKEYIHINKNFKSAINLYLNLNNREKVLNYIPTKTSLKILDEYLDSIKKNTNKATMLIGPYGKGKSHLILILLAIISMKRDEDNKAVIKQLVTRVNEIDKNIAKKINTAWEQDRFLPVIVSSSFDDVDQAFLIGLNDALRRDGLDNLAPNTFYSIALDRINEWEVNYKETYEILKKLLAEENIDVSQFKADLREYNKGSMEIFKGIYPRLTSGSEFNPMLSSDVLKMFRDVNTRIKEEYGYKGIYIIFDEFSKFIESKDGLSSGNDMNTIQKICELAQNSNDPQLHITFITHKSIKEYGGYLTKETIDGFRGIEGRITERFFITSNKNNYELIKNAIVKKSSDLEKNHNILLYINDLIAEKYYNKIPIFKSTFNFQDFKEIVVEGCYPMNPITTYMILNISEKVAQNERTLFTFISKDEPDNIARYIEKHNSKDSWIIDVDIVYDYFRDTFKSDVVNKSIYNEWLKAETAINRCENKLEIKVIKALALILINNKPEELPANKKMLEYATSIKNIDKILNSLANKDLIYYKDFSDRYDFRTSIGSELSKEISKERLLIKNNFNISKSLNEVLKDKYLLPKKYNQDFSMTRYFKYEFIECSVFLEIKEANSFFSSEEFCDGKILILINDNDIEFTKNNIEKKIIELSDERIVVIFIEDKLKIENLIKDYEIIKKLKMSKILFEENNTLGTELKFIEDEIIFELRNYINRYYFDNSDRNIYYFSNGNLVTKTRANINRIISNICLSYYSDTPIINNELINKEYIKSGPIKRARKNLIEYILSGLIDSNFFNKTNAEATIYRALFINTGIINGIQNEKISKVLDIIKNFLKNSSENKQELQLLIKELKNPPIALRSGGIPLYFAHELAKVEGDKILYIGDKEFEVDSDSIINMFEQEANYEIFISMNNFKKEKYISELKKLFVEEQITVENYDYKEILNQMQRWYRSLPQVTRLFTSDISGEINSQELDLIIKIRSELQKSDLNPYKKIFLDIPEILSEKKDYDEVVIKIKKIKDLLDNHLNSLLEVSLDMTKNIFDAQESDLYHSLKEWYYKQNENSKKVLFTTEINILMGFIESLSIYDDKEITRKLVKIITGTYIENWNEKSIQIYKSELSRVISEIENIGSEKTKEKEISFTNSKGEKVTKFYDSKSGSSGKIMKNIIEETLEDFEDSVDLNDRVAILVEMLEKVLE